MNSKHNKGFTLIEMMVTVAVLAIILGIGVPSFQGLIERNRVSTATDKLFSALTTARSEAIRLGQDVRVTQATGGWRNGWTIASPTTTLRVENALPGNVAISEAGAATQVVFSVNGWVTAPASRPAVFEVSLANSSVTPRQIAVNQIGHIQSRLKP